MLLQSEGAGKQGETEVTPSAGEVSYLLCRWCRKASKAPREAAGAEDTPRAVTKKAQVKNTRTQKNSMIAVLTGWLARGDGAQKWLP